MSATIRGSILGEYRCNNATRHCRFLDCLWLNRACRGLCVVDTCDVEQRHAIKQMWQMRKQAKQQFEQQRQAQQDAERHYTERGSEGSVIDGEYKDLSDRNDKS